MWQLPTDLLRPGGMDVPTIRGENFGRQPMSGESSLATDRSTDAVEQPKKYHLQTCLLALLLHSSTLQSLSNQRLFVIRIQEESKWKPK